MPATLAYSAVIKMPRPASTAAPLCLASGSAAPISAIFTFAVIYDTPSDQSGTIRLKALI
jgi:hypothetical protein